MSYGHSIRLIGPDHYRLDWTIDRKYPSSRLRFPTSYARDTDRAGALRFAKKWDAVMPGGGTEGYALTKSSDPLWPGGHVLVRITKRGKRYAEVETLHENPAERRSWREVSRGLWDFPTLDAANEALEGLLATWREQRPAAAAQATPTSPHGEQP